MNFFKRIITKKDKVIIHESIWEKTCFSHKEDKPVFFALQLNWK
jgi:hypothetical protein